MPKIRFTAAVIGAFLAGYFFGCGDELFSAEGAQRFVYEASEANVTGAGGVIEAPQVHVGHEGSGGANMSQVIVYGSGYGNNDTWRTLSNVDISEGEVKVDTNEYPSYYYRVVAVW